MKIQLIISLITLSILLSFCTKSKLSKKDTIPNGNWEWVYSTQYYYMDTIADISSTSNRYQLEINDFLNYKFYKNEEENQSGSFGGLFEYTTNRFTPENQELILQMTYYNSLLYVEGGYPYSDYSYTNVYKLKP